jgi:hypothetical protein
MAEALRTTDAEASPHAGGTAPPVLSKNLPLLGHLLELRKHPIELFARVRDE